MSENICYTEAFILSVSDFINLLEPEHLPGIKKDAIRLYRERMASEDDAKLQSRVCSYTTVIKSARTIRDVADFLISLVKDGIERKKKRFRKEVYKAVFEEVDEDFPEIILIQCLSRVVLPCEPESVVLFSGYRDFQWEGPMNEPLLQFDPDEFFERRLTDAGEAMARTLGKTEIEVHSWVERV